MTDTRDGERMIRGVREVSSALQIETVVFVRHEYIPGICYWRVPGAYKKIKCP